MNFMEPPSRNLKFLTHFGAHLAEVNNNQLLNGVFFMQTVVPISTGLLGCLVRRYISGTEPVQLGSLKNKGV